ncbi:hypothetical protein LXT21_17815 [Myxococcus sp. K38C18041901]|uniref:hypothetical protein n=1 Tax=Myxococcus guangdongensis TaxID=2906760 RepID=UPI0020A6DF63|nr:hypothetical protein [Myxococcus guangdongensis]MCP3060644.1 hypothetical protein [Myxococcus guangdongensis]
MQAGRFISGALVAVGLMLAGCGGPLEEDLGEHEAASREGLVPDCSTTSAGTVYYPSATSNRIVGFRGCGCGSWTSWGTTTAYSRSTNACIPPVSPPEA